MIFEIVGSALTFLLTIHIAIEIYHYIHSYADARRLKRIEKTLKDIKGCLNG